MARHIYRGGADPERFIHDVLFGRIKPTAWHPTTSVERTIRIEQDTVDERGQPVRLFIDHPVRRVTAIEFDSDETPNPNGPPDPRPGNTPRDRR